MIRRIFNLAKDGLGISRIRQILTDEKLPRPAAYACDNGASFDRFFENNEANRYVWSNNSVHRTWTFSVPTDGKMENGEDYYIRLIYATNTDIKRFIKIKAKANPFDENWQLYFEERADKQMRNEIKGRTIINRLYKDQQGCCSYCSGKITLETDFRIHQVGDGTNMTKRLVHPECHEKLHALKNNEMLVLERELIET